MSAGHEKKRAMVRGALSDSGYRKEGRGLRGGRRGLNVYDRIGGGWDIFHVVVGVGGMTPIVRRKVCCLPGFARVMSNVGKLVFGCEGGQQM